MSSPAFAGTDASRSQTRILTPSSEGSLNRKDGPTPTRPPSPDRRKRKRADSVAMDHLLKPSIALKPHPPNLHVPPRVLQPLMVIPREQLPLSCIDFNTSNVELAPGRLFESHIKILDLESRMGSVPVVLLARYESSRSVYALERQDNGLYVACRLGAWIDLSSLAKHATAACHERLRSTARPESRGRTASAAMTTPQLQKDHKVKRAAIEAIQSLVRKRARSQSISTFEDPIKSDDNALVPKPVESQLPSPLLQQEDLPDVDTLGKMEVVAPPVSNSIFNNPEESAPQQTAEVIFENIRTQYFEALYKSMGSLAYFAKGPLSRARSAFHLDLESSLDMGDLIEFLKNLVLTTVQVDKKYRDTIPDIITKMKAIVESSDEGRKKKRRAKKMKLGKDGMYPYEEDHVQKWWMANKPDLHDDEATIPTQQIKSLASMLRTRETQLQMILILEILALTPLRAAEDAEDSQLPPLPGALESQEGMAPPPKKRNKHNLPVLIDVHADRLTIWQSTVSDEQLLLEDSQATHQSGDGQLQQKGSSEPLKDFCIDVIVPFFSARLPELCDSINRKLGGPVIVKPSKSRSLKRSSSKREQKPGAVTKRPSQQPRTLQRALSTEQHHRRSISRGPSNMIALMRSATSTSVPGIKREGSEPAALKGVLKGEPDLLNRRSGPLSRSTSMSNLRDTKPNKKALVEAELKDAISALRKPHREIVSKELMDAAERRTLTGLSAKKVRRPARSSLGTSIVKATPANNRFKDVFAAKSESVADVPLISTEEVIPPSSMPSMIPSTGLRGSRRDAFRFSPSPVMDRIDSTPTKGSSFLHRLRDDSPGLPPSSPLMERKAMPQERFLVSGTAMKEQRKIDFTLSRDEGILATPIKSVAMEFNNIGAKLDEPVGNSMSIYQKLGWDDELDDLL